MRDAKPVRILNRHWCDTILEARIGAHEYPPYLRSEATSQYAGNCRESLYVYTTRLGSGSSEVFFFFFFSPSPFVTFIVGGGFSIRLREY